MQKFDFYDYARWLRIFVVIVPMLALKNYLGAFILGFILIEMIMFRVEEGFRSRLQRIEIEQTIRRDLNQYSKRTYSAMKNQWRGLSEEIKTDLITQFRGVR